MSSSVPSSWKAAVLSKPHERLVIKTVSDRGDLKPREVLVRVLACGVCGTDLGIRNGNFGTDILPRVLGHELVGDVVAVGTAVERVREHDRVGGAWHGGHDGSCRACARGQYNMCAAQEINGVSRDGGFAEYAVLREEAVVRVPRDMDPAQAAPLMCAGVTVFNAMRKLHVEQGNLVAVQGIGGLGHLAIQYASRMGYHVVALSRGTAKRQFALDLGAHEYVDTSDEPAEDALARMGGAALICATAPNPKLISPLVNGLQPGGKLLVLAPIGPVEFDTTTLVIKGASVHGYPSGHALDAEEALQFAQDHKVRCVIEKYRLEDVNKAIAKVEDGSVRFRGVLVFGPSEEKA